MDRRLTLGPKPPCKYSGGSKEGGPPAPYFLTKMRPEGPKIFFFLRPGPPLSQGLCTRLSME